MGLDSFTGELVDELNEQKIMDYLEGIDLSNFLLERGLVNAMGYSNNGQLAQIIFNVVNEDELYFVLNISKDQQQLTGFKQYTKKGSEFFDPNERFWELEKIIKNTYSKEDISVNLCPDKPVECYFAGWTCGSSVQVYPTIDIDTSKIEDVKDLILTVMRGSGIELDNKQDSDLIDTLITQGISPLYAQVIAAEFEDLKDASPATIASKNQVYHVGGKIVKFVNKKDEADIEAKVNFHFSRDKRLAHLVPKSDLDEAIEVQIGDTTKYITIQEDVSSKSREQGLDYWLKNALPRIHVYGTKVMDKEGIFRKANTVTDERSEGMIEESGLVIDTFLRDEMKSLDLEDVLTFIHQDLRRQNQEGQYAIDWGNAGRGNPYIDLARVLLDSQLQKGNIFDESDYKKHLHTYLTERNNLMKIDAPSDNDVNQAYNEFRKVALVFSQKQAAYLITKGDDCSPGELQDKEFLSHTAKNIERELVRSPAQMTKYETGNAVIYHLPTLGDVAKVA
jgi:thiamine kinase-like enzyme